METKHTPGPWRVKTIEEFPLTDENYKTIVGGDGVYNTQTGFELTGFIGEANARLIACAPELLDALEDANKMINNHFGLNDNDEGGNETHDKIRSAISKAKGN